MKREHALHRSAAGCAWLLLGDSASVALPQLLHEVVLITRTVSQRARVLRAVARLLQADQSDRIADQGVNCG